MGHQNSSSDKINYYCPYINSNNDTITTQYIDKLLNFFSVIAVCHGYIKYMYMYNYGIHKILVEYDGPISEIKFVKIYD